MEPYNGLAAAVGAGGAPAEANRLEQRSVAATADRVDVCPPNASDVGFSSPARGESRFAGPGEPQASRNDSNPPHIRACARALDNHPLARALCTTHPHAHPTQYNTIGATATTPAAASVPAAAAFVSASAATVSAAAAVPAAPPPCPPTATVPAAPPPCLPRPPSSLLPLLPCPPLPLSCPPPPFHRCVPDCHLHRAYRRSRCRHCACQLFRRARQCYRAHHTVYEYTVKHGVFEIAL